MKKRMDTLFVNADVVDVFTGQIVQLGVGVKDGLFQGFGFSEADEIIDLDGCYMLPGLVDAHVHIESSMAVPARFAEAVLPCGTTSCIADPHEVANVAGLAGVEYMIAAARDLPMNINFALPSCVPATHMETAGAAIAAKDMEKLIGHPQVAALGEMMNFPGVIYGDAEVLAKIRLAQTAGKPVDGHAPSLSGTDLCIYAGAGIASDHECTSAEEAIEKLRLGMHIMIREGSGAKNLDDLFEIIDEHTWPRLMWCTDDRSPADILGEGHIDFIIRRAVEKGLDPLRAIQMGTINCTDYFGLDDIGAIAPGRRADFIICERLDDFRPRQVYAGGRLVAEGGTFVAGSARTSAAAPLEIMHLDGAGLDLAVQEQPGKIRIINVVRDQIVTESDSISPRVAGGLVVADPERDIAKIAVIERYSGAAGKGIGFVRGLGLARGAVAASVAHDSHNIITAGTNDDDMLAAVQRVIDMKGGFAVAGGEEMLASMALPIAGLMTDRPLERIAGQMAVVNRAVRELGTSLHDPFMTLAFLALPVIPALKITDKGLVDVSAFRLVDLFVEP